MSPQVCKEKQPEGSVPLLTAHAVRGIEQSGEETESEGGNRNCEKQGGPAPKPQAPSITSIQSTGVKHVRRNVE